MQVERFNVIYSKEAIDFLSRIEPKTKIKILSNIDKAIKIIDTKFFKKLVGDIWEFRALSENKQYRMLAFWDKTSKNPTLVILTHGFIKKTSKVPQKEIDKAKQIMKLYYQKNKLTKQ